MKHLKYYENKENIKFKNFTIVKSFKAELLFGIKKDKNIPLFLVSTDNSEDQTKDRYHFIKYRYYEDGNTDDLKIGEVTIGDIKKSDMILIYQSNNYKECLTMFNSLSNANKYNL